MEQGTVIVTGASLGVGAAVARQVVAAGANVVLVARSREPLEALAAELDAPDRVAVHPLDVTDGAAVEAMLEAVRQRFGGFDALVNNAGYHARGPVLHVEAEALGRMVDVNLKAPIVLARLALPYLQAREGGAIVNVASLAGRTIVPGSATYSATKFGLRAFTFALAEELRGSGVRVAVLSPGPITTGFILDDIDSVSDLTFSQPLSSAEEVASAIIALFAPGPVEVAMPRASGYLTTLGYLFPALGRALRPSLERRGRRTKERLKAQRGPH